MKLSILTATYNRENTLSKLYQSIASNLYDKLEVEWLIMDDGSTDSTKKLVQDFIDKSNFSIKYYYQDNKGKMSAINNLVKYAQGELIIECDSDDYFMENAFEKIYSKAGYLLEDDELYALIFLRDMSNMKVSGKNFKREDFKTSLFDMYFKENMDGEKIILYKTSVRKMYKYVLEEAEKFSTEARMHYKIEEKYKVKCFNLEVVSGEYLQQGYTKNINKIFIENPLGYFKYFKEILSRDIRGITFDKRLYVVKHYILFAVLSKSRIDIKCIKNFVNKFLVFLLYWPGVLKSKIFMKNIGKISHETQAIDNC